MATDRPLHRWAAHGGSTRTTLLLFALLAAVAFARPTMAPLGAVIAALAANLGLSLWRHAGLRRRPALLVAHLALLALVVSVGVGKLLALDGRFELTEGVPFDGHLLDRDAGPLHRDALQRLSFTQLGFDIDYAPGRKRGATRNRVTWTEGGVAREAVIGDHVPLVLDGHRLYTSPNKGFAPLLRWVGRDGAPVLGAVHLPSYPMHELRQSREWTLPDGRTAWLLLDFDDTPIPSGQAASFRLPAQHRLVLRLDDRRWTLAPGEAVELPGGTLRYERLATWMGYRIAYDPSLGWSLAAALLSTLALAVHWGGAFGWGRRASAVASVRRPGTSPMEWADG